MTSNLDVAVIGAGVFGAWTAEHVRRAGHRVTLVDMAGPAHERSSSGCESRLTRAAYGPDQIYSRMALASLDEWQALSARAGLPIFHPCGILFFFGDEDDPYFRATAAAHRDLDLPTQVLSASEMAARFPMIDFDGISVGLHEPHFGALMARRAVQTLVAGFVANGGTYVQASVEPPSGESGLKRVATTAGPIAADRFVFALGSWLPALFPNLLARKITPTRQEVFFFAPPSGDARFLPDAMPGWSDFNAGEMVYGFPDLEGRGVKFACDRHGPVVDPDTQPRSFSPKALDEVVAYRDRRFPALRGAPLTGARVCQYENSSNGDFLIDRHPDFDNVVLVGGGSGHGFKHGPEVGRLAAALSLSGAAQSEPRFALASKSDRRARAVH